MKSRSQLGLFLTVALTAVSVLAGTGAQTPVAEGVPAQNVLGRVTLAFENSRVPIADQSRAVVWLVPLDRGPELQVAADQRRYQMAQRNKSFQPNMLVVPVGTAVDFPNFDPWFHNVFSLYQGKRFDLGLYEAGSWKQVIFDRLGASYIFCNIHPQMHAVVLAVDSRYFGISDKAGRISIPNVPSGRYELHAWYENAAPKTLEAAERRIEVGDANRALPPISIEAVKQDPMKHKNKYGEEYDPADQTTIY